MTRLGVLYSRRILGTRDPRLLTNRRKRSTAGRRGEKELSKYCVSLSFSLGDCCAPRDRARVRYQLPAKIAASTAAAENLFLDSVPPLDDALTFGCRPAAVGPPRGYTARKQVTAPVVTVARRSCAFSVAHGVSFTLVSPLGRKSRGGR